MTLVKDMPDTNLNNSDIEMTMVSAIIASLERSNGSFGETEVHHN